MTVDLGSNSGLWSQYGNLRSVTDNHHLPSSVSPTKPVFTAKMATRWWRPCCPSGDLPQWCSLTHPAPESNQSDSGTQVRLSTTHTHTHTHHTISPDVFCCVASAGVGRTGCFIVIEAMLERIKYEKTVDVYGHVTCMRAARNYMVQTEEQYVFIHEALLEATSCGCTEVIARSLYGHIQKLTQTAPGETLTPMELEFKVNHHLFIYYTFFVEKPFLDSRPLLWITDRCYGRHFPTVESGSGVTRVSK